MSGNLVKLCEARLAKISRSLLISALLISAHIGCSPQTQDEAAQKGAAPEETAAAPVLVQAAKAKTITLRPTLELVGVVVAIPEKTAVISPQLGGWIKKLDVVEGESVHAGDKLIELNASSAQIAVERAQAVVDEKAAAVVRLKRGYLPEEIAAARQDATNASAALQGLQNELKALKRLLARNEISQVLYETKAKAVESAQAALASAQERAKLLEAGTRPEMINEAQGLLNAAKADAEQAALALKWCTITSPIDGVVVQLLARQGQFFDKAVPMIIIMDLSSVFVQLRIPTRDFAKVQQGTAVEVRFDSLPKHAFSGTIERISGQAEPTTGNVVVFALIKNKDHLLRPGLSCHSKVGLPSIAKALVVPLSAVADNSGTSVVTVIRDGKAYETEVAIGSETDEYAQIEQGLEDGDLVATAGGIGLPEGCPVKVVADLARDTNASNP